VFIHFLFNRQYGYFRDELYYAACGEHLAWGYVDHAPLVAFASAFTRALFGDSLFALRLLPALSAAPKVLLAGWMAREAGGGKFSQFFAALLVLLAPIYLTFDNFLSMNAFEPVFWMLCAAIVLRILNGGNPRLWLLFGVVAGLGLLNKHSMLFFGSGLALGLLLAPARAQFARVEIWLGAAIAFLIFLPNLLWEIRHAYPTIALLNTVIGSKYTTVSPLSFVAEQFLLVNPLAAPIWLGGLWYLLADKQGRRYAVLGIAYLVVLVEMLLLHGKIYYLAPAYIMLLAAGAVAWEQRIFARAKAWLKPVVIAALVVAGIVAAPLAMPILPVAAAVKYCKFFGVEDVKVENVPLDSLPQLFGDMFGWPEHFTLCRQRTSRGLRSSPTTTAKPERLIISESTTGYPKPSAATTSTATGDRAAPRARWSSPSVSANPASINRSPTCSCLKSFAPPMPCPRSPASPSIYVATLVRTWPTPGRPGGTSTEQKAGFGWSRGRGRKRISAMSRIITSSSKNSVGNDRDFA